MRTSGLTLATLLFTLPAFAATSATDVAHLVHEQNIEPALNDALRSPDALVRATAARVAGIRDAKGTLPALREIAPTDIDASALREEIRTLALIGEAGDVDVAIAAAAKQSAAFDAVVADAVGRRGGAETIELFMTRVKKLRDTRGFFERALWGHDEAVGVAAERLLAANDAAGWTILLRAMFDAARSLPAARIVAALESSSEDIRQSTAWFLVNGYAADPASMNTNVRAALTREQTAAGSDREDFARELLRRMLGQAPSDPQRWLKWLASAEADDRLPVEPAVYTYLTGPELALRESRCKNMPVACPVTPKSDTRVHPSSPVAKAAFSLPGTLPAGLADLLLRGNACQWLGVGSATVDHSGRVQSVDLRDIQTSCKNTLETIVKLSYATNATIASPTTTGNILFVKARNAAVCLDENPGDVGGAMRTGGNVVAPIVKHRAEPHFPESARGAMGKNSSVLVIVDSVITRTGCVRSINLLAQSQWPEINGAAVLALSQWRFEPGRFEGKPVDTIFNLTVRFKVGF